MIENQVPVLNWFEANPWDKKGNMFTSSVGGESIHNNAFLYRVNFYREDEGSKLVAECYDCVLQMKNAEDEYVSAEFEGTEQGRTDMINWLKEQYAEFVKSGRANQIIKF